MSEIKKRGYRIEINTSSLIANLTKNALLLVTAISTGDIIAISRAISPFLDIIKCIDIKSSKEKIIYEYIYNSLKKATIEVISFIDKEKISKAKTKNILKKLPKKEKIILDDDNILRKPGLSKLSLKYVDLLCEALETISTINELDIEIIRSSWNYTFSKCAKEEWERNLVKNSEITEHDFLAPMQEYVNEIIKKEKYEENLKELINSNVFDEDCTLDDIFIDLNCVVDMPNTITNDNRITGTIETLYEWSISTKNGMLLLEGDPGSGKSTILKELARKLLNKHVNVIYFNLFKLNFSNKKNCIDVFQDKLSKLSWYKELEICNDSDTVYILDGLDEIQCDVWGNSIELVSQLINSDFYKQQKLIISGRNRIIEHCHEKIGNIKTLTILPLNFKNDSFATELFDVRPCLWEKLNKVFDLNIQFSEIAIKENLNEISENPLLLFLLAWTFKNEPDSVDKVDNSVQLYRLILNCIYNRKYSRRKDECFENKIEYNSYLKILYAIGTSAWQNNKREIPVFEIEKYCDKMNLTKEYNKWFNDKECLGSSKLFLMFFAHENRKFNNSSFEFMHKSFYEYLSIEEIMLQIKNCKNLSQKQIIVRFFYLLSRNYIDTDFIYYFIEDLYTKDMNDFLLLKDNLFYINSLLEDEKVDKYIYSNKTESKLFCYKNIKSFFEGYRYVHNNIWRLIEYIFIIYGKNPKLNIQSELNISNINLSNLNLKISNLKYSILTDCIIDNLNINTFVQFTDGKWTNCQLIECAFCQANFNRVEMKSTRFYSIHFEAASFCRTKIYNVLFDNTLLNASFFNNAEVCDTTFEDCILDFANFDDAIFKDTKFLNCSFENADFNSAIFHKCHFVNCSFINAKLNNVRLSDFNFEDENLIENLLEADYSNSNFVGLPEEINIKFRSSNL